MSVSELVQYTNVKREQETEGVILRWRMLRWQTAALLNVHTKNTIKPEDLIKLPDDKRAKVKPITDEMRETWKRWDAEKLRVIS